MSLLLERLRGAALLGQFMLVLRDELKGDKAEAEVVEVLVELQRNGDFDVLSEFKALDKVDVGCEAFSLVLLFNKWLLGVSAPMADVLNCVMHVEGLMAGAGTIQAFEDYCKKERGRPHSALEVALESSNLFPLISSIMIAGSAYDFPFFHNRALLLLKSESAITRAQALMACARFSYDGACGALEKTINCIEQLISAPCDEDQKSIALSALISMASTPGRNNELLILAVIKKILLDHRPLIVRAAARAFAMVDIVKNSQLACMLLEFFEAIPVVDKGILDIVSVGLQKYLIGDRFIEAIEFVECLLEKHESLSLSSFGHVSYLLSRAENRTLLGFLITRWLLSNNYKLAGSIAALVAGDGLSGIPVSADANTLKALPSDSPVLLAKKACAYLFVYPVSAASYIISMMAILPPEKAESLAGVLYYPLGMSYPSSVKEYINSLWGPHSSSFQSAINTFNEALSEYHNGLSVADGAEELQPSVAQREAYNLKFHREMQESFNGARKNSLLTQLMGKPSVILYGNSSINYIYPGKGDDRLRQETPMQSVSTSMEFPSLDCLEHHQLEYFLRISKMTRITK
ncbi:hypothetical protein HU732_20440 [Pseudomonas proteolytica]|uniref:hypothetical protein n=1 Tax=Pseudomonas proteolytica TaxID=219574 RepID=UPI0016454965|nr:hypothetical protein [Pseudomonas proteolytica]MBC3338682.1 hypothetical protein [Pseudomonas proteolytica]